MNCQNLRSDPKSRIVRLFSWAVLPLVVSGFAVAELPSFDFQRASEFRGWNAIHHIPAVDRTTEGLRVTIVGGDPYFHSPTLDLPTEQPLWLNMRLQSEQGGSGQIFYFDDQATEERSIRFQVPAGQWHDVKLRLPPLGPGYRLRIDPPGDRGFCLFAHLQFEPRTAFVGPPWPKPTSPEVGPHPWIIRSGDLEMRHGGNALGDFEIAVAGKRLASGNNQGLLGYAYDDDVRWIPFGHGPEAAIRATAVLDTSPSGREGRGGLRLDAEFPDPDGGRWAVQQIFTAASDGTIAVLVTVRVDAERELLYLPMLTLLPGLGEFGTNKSQALFAGVEYLENEPSSSTADLDPPASHRQVPDRIKLTFPLMAIAANDRYIGLSWTPGLDTELCAMFDSPDRFFHSGAHVMSLLVPGSDGSNREESSLIPSEPLRLVPGDSMQLKASILGGRGHTVVPALQHYVRLNGLPPIPELPWSKASYYELVARSWLESKVREGTRFRHAVWPGFPPSPATDAAYQMQWLAERVDHPGLARQLSAEAQAAMVGLSPASLNDRQIGHVRYPIPALIHLSAAAAALQASHTARQLIGRFESDGVVPYEPRPEGMDYGRTHWAPDANGLTAQIVVQLLDAATFSGDRTLIAAGLRQLRAMLARYDSTVPRGAQTWEIPLHTPDILAAAHLVRACVIGYELTGDRSLLEHARYWAWSGVPFVYLTPPTAGPVGLYNTIAVFGATSWIAPIWLGQPVQWCGLVYANALYGLARHDPTGPWKHIADGISVGGMQHTWADDPDRFGLLADYFLLRSQRREGPAINPATLFLPAIRMWNEPDPYEFRAFHISQVHVHAPGKLADVVDTPERVAFRVHGWWPDSYELLLHGLDEKPYVHLNNEPAPESQCIYDQNAGRLTLRVKGSPHVELQLRR
jgi:hypothetical protein